MQMRLEDMDWITENYILESNIDRFMNKKHKQEKEDADNI